jgi:hypothetical protein
MKSASFTFKLASPSPKDPLSIFHVAQGFFLAGQRCLLEIRVGPSQTQYLPGAGVANLCFAIELFLKSLIVLLGKESPKTHKLVELIGLLPTGELDPIRAAYGQQVQQPPLDDLLAEVSQFFVKLRYEFEHDIFSLNEHPVYVLADILYQHCAARNNNQGSVKGVSA